MKWSWKSRCLKNIFFIGLVSILFGSSFVTRTDADDVMPTITYSHVDLSLLTDSEKERIIQENPSQLLPTKDQKITLVYSKKVGCVNSQKMNSTASVKEKSKSILPKTGEILTVYNVVGIIFLGSSLLMLRSKKGRFTLLCALTIGSLSWKTLANEVSKISADTVIRSDQVATYFPEELECYTYVGYIPDEELPKKPNKSEDPIPPEQPVVPSTPCPNSCPDHKYGNSTIVIQLPNQPSKDQDMAENQNPGDSGQSDDSHTELSDLENASNDSLSEESDEVTSD